MSNREINCRRLANVHFFGVVGFITFNYLLFVLEYMLQVKPTGYIPILIVFHILFVLLLWSDIKTILGDPGRVPIYWGFFAEESQNRRRRYCLLCHSFKPQRCHHCSTCQRCVLNMDHHCPWINNCVGFNNRKFFMLFLFYIIVILLFCICCEAPILIQEIINVVNDTSLLSVHSIIRAVGFIVQCVFFVVITMFFKFHVELVLSNSSTLDNLERQRNPNAGPNIYNVGTYENFVQVFGSNYCLWLIPVASPPNNRANGVVWPRNN